MTAPETYVERVRRHLGLTQAEMAERMGLSLRAFADIERGVSAERQVHILAARQLLSPVDALVDHYRDLVSGMENRVRLMTTGQLHVRENVGSGMVDITEREVERVRQQIADLQAIIDRHGQPAA